MLTSLDQLKTNFDMVGDRSKYAGSMEKEFLSAIATSEGATGLATNGLSALNITMGQFLLPTVVKVSGYISSATKTMRAWAQEHPLLAKGIIIRPLASYGLPDSLRVSIGSEQENQAFITSLEEILGSHA